MAFCNRLSLKYRNKKLIKFGHYILAVVSYRSALCLFNTEWQIGSTKKLTVDSIALFAYNSQTDCSHRRCSTSCWTICET
jgi:hypothetical protein